MVETCDVVVVGAGPAGLIAARELRRAGVGAVLLLDKDEMPRPKPCAGGIGPGARASLARLGLLAAIDQKAHPLTALRLVGPGGRETYVRNTFPASVLPRTELDALLVEAAVSEGVVFRPRARVERVVERDGRVLGVEVAGRPITARWVVVAAGATSPLRWDGGGSRVLDTCMAWFERLPFVPGQLEMIFDSALCPHYGWLFPESAKRVNLGLCIDRARRRGSVRELFARFLERHFGARLAGATQIGPWRGHPITGCEWIEHRAPDGVLLVGEANRLVNTATGEGISQAICSGMLAAEVIARARPSDPPAAVAAAYLGRLRRALGWGLLAGGLFEHVGTFAIEALTRLGSRRYSGRLTRGMLADR